MREPAVAAPCREEPLNRTQAPHPPARLMKLQVRKHSPNMTEAQDTPAGGLEVQEGLIHFSDHLANDGQPCSTLPHDSGSTDEIIVDSLQTYAKIENNALSPAPSSWRPRHLELVLGLETRPQRSSWDRSKLTGRPSALPP